MTFSAFRITPIRRCDDSNPYFNQNTIYSFIDNISKVKGTHVFKVGIYYEHTQEDPERQRGQHGHPQLQYRHQQSQ